MTFLPKQAAESCLRRAQRFLDLADEDLPMSRVKNDLRRMALVMAVAAVDSYMHSVVIRRVANARRRTELPKALASLELPFSDIAYLADASIAAQRVGRRSRPWVQVKVSLQRRLLRETFQSYDQVAKALSIAGIDKAWSKIADEFGESTADLKSWLNDLGQRRNQIVHEGDMKRASRPRELRFNKVVHDQVKDDVAKMRALIRAMDAIVMRHR